MKRPLFAIICIILIAILCGCSLFVDEKPIETSTSPEGTHTVTAMLVNGGATVAYSVKVYLKALPFDILIYNKYKQKTVTITWLSEDVICINGVDLDLSKGETYDWRDN